MDVSEPADHGGLHRVLVWLKCLATRSSFGLVCPGGELRGHAQPVYRSTRQVLLRLRTLLRLTLAELNAMCLAIPMVIAVRVALWLLPSRRIVQVVRAFEAGSFPARSGRLPANTIVWAVEAVARRIPMATCLTQALAAKCLLRLFRHDARLCLGVAYSPSGALRAHAWLEREGRPILGGEGVSSLTRLPMLPNGAHERRD